MDATQPAASAVTTSPWRLARGEMSLLASASQDETIRLWDVHSGVCLQTLRTPGPYAGMNIKSVTGISEAQKAALKALGAVEG